MLRIFVPGQEYFNEKTQEFICENDTILELEHSLYAVSLWEAKWKKPFMTDNEKTVEETLDYIRCMTLSPVKDASIYSRLSNKNYSDILQYIEDSATATWFNENKATPSREIVTSELIYYWMATFGIPFECDRWNIHRLLTLIRICGIKNQAPKKMSPKAAAISNTNLNRLRKQKLHTRG